MNALFISLYLDEDVNVLIADLVRARDFTIITAVSVGNLGKSDEEQLAFAATNGYALLTHNRADFEALAQEYLAHEKQHHGLLLAVRRSPHELARRILVILNNAPPMKCTIRYATSEWPFSSLGASLVQLFRAPLTVPPCRPSSCRS